MDALAEDPRNDRSLVFGGGLRLFRRRMRAAAADAFDQAFQLGPQDRSHLNGISDGTKSPAAEPLRRQRRHSQRWGRRRGSASSFDAASFDSASFDAASFDAANFDAANFDAAGPLAPA